MWFGVIIVLSWELPDFPLGGKSKIGPSVAISAVAELSCFPHVCYSIVSGCHASPIRLWIKQKFASNKSSNFCLHSQNLLFSVSQIHSETNSQLDKQSVMLNTMRRMNNEANLQLHEILWTTSAKSTSSTKKMQTKLE